jgi:hypothetical protein
MLETRVQGCPNFSATREFNLMTLTVVKAYRFHMIKALESPCEANGGVLTAREQNKCALGR